MHGRDREPAHHAPGLTPLTGQYLRPGKSWVCYSTLGPYLPYLSSHDRSSVGDSTVCVLTDQVLFDAKLAYYASRALSALAALPPPI